MSRKDKLLIELEKRSKLLTGVPKDDFFAASVHLYKVIGLDTAIIKKFLVDEIVEEENK